jgi:hypothetical protein
VLFPPAQANFAYWRDRNACSGTTPDERIDVGERFCETYTQCDAGVQVGLCSIAASPTARTDSGGSGHETYLNPDLDIARTAWEFLSQFSLPDP